MLKNKSLQVNNDLQRELMRGQEKVIAMYRKRLTPKFQKELQDFAQSGKQIGSSDFFKLSPLVREVMVKMNTANVDTMIQSTKNPFKKLQYWIGKIAITQLSNVDPKKKKKKKKKGKELAKKPKKLKKI